MRSHQWRVCGTEDGEAHGPAGPKLDAHASFIEEILKSDLSKKRRRTILPLFSSGCPTTADSRLRPTERRSLNCLQRRSTLVTSAGKVSSQAPVRRKSAGCLVPVVYAQPDVLAKGCVDAVAITVGADEIARHPRSYGSADFVFDPLRGLALLETKAGALDQASPLQNGAPRDDFPTLRRLREARLSGKNRCTAGKRECVQVLRLLETFPVAAVHGAVAAALRLGAISCDAIRRLALRRIKRRSPMIIDELGFVPLSRTGAEPLFELISERGDCGAAIITSNPPLDE